MSLFSWKKDKDKNKTGDCGCNCNCDSETMEQAVAAKAGGARIKVLGTGCDKCNRMKEATREALAELGLDTTVEQVTDLMQIAAYGVMSTPALVVDGKVVSYGQVLKKEEIAKFLQNIQK